MVFAVVSETNNVSTFSTPKFQQILKSRDGRNLFIQCLLTDNNSPSEDRMREGGYHEKEITMAIADHVSIPYYKINKCSSLISIYDLFN